MFGPAHDRVIARIQQYDDTQAEHNLCVTRKVQYVKRVVYRTVQLSRSLPVLGPALDGFLLETKEEDHEKVIKNQVQQ